MRPMPMTRRTVMLARYRQVFPTAWASPSQLHTGKVCILSLISNPGAESDQYSNTLRRKTSFTARLWRDRRLP